MQAVVFGGSGFVGQAVVSALRSKHPRIADVVVVKAPRISVTPDNFEQQIESQSRAYLKVLAACRNFEIVINAAGLASPAGTLSTDLLAANAALPGLVGRAAREAGATRYIHISSAAVQGRVSCLTDDLAERGFSPYSWSKVLGERAAMKFGPRTTVIHRPAGVHAADRRVTQQIARFAASRLSVVGGDGNCPTPQALVDNVGDAVAFLATCAASPPVITVQPWEGLTTGLLLQLLGGRQPRRIPSALARALVSGLNVVGDHMTLIRPYGRRVELLLLGQAQQESWLTTQGWRPPSGMDGWRELGAQLSREVGVG